MYHKKKKSYGYGGTIKQRLGGTVDYGLGGAALKFGSNLVQNLQQGKKLGDGLLQGTLQGVTKAAVTPGSGIGAGAQLAGNLLQGANNPFLQNFGQGLNVASNFAPGGDGPLAALSGVAGLAGTAGAQGQGLMNTLANLGGQGGGAGGQGFGNLLNLASNFLGEQGMAVPLKNKNVKLMKFPMMAGGNSPLPSHRNSRTQSMQETSPVTNPYTEGSKMYDAFNQAMMALGQSDLGALQGRDTAFQPRFNLGQAFLGGYGSPTYDVTKERAQARGKELGRPAAGRFFASPEEYRESDVYKESMIPFDQIIGGNQPGRPEEYEPYGEGVNLFADDPTEIEPAAKAQAFFRDKFEQSFGDEGLTKGQQESLQEQIDNLFGTYENPRGPQGNLASSSPFSRGEIDFGVFGQPSGEQSYGGRAPISQRHGGMGVPTRRGVRLMKRGMRR